MRISDTYKMMYEKKDSPPWNTGKQDYAGAAKELRNYAMKDGGIDKKDMLAVASQLASQAKSPSASVGARMMRNIQGLDTDVREKIHSILKKHGLKESLESDLKLVEEMEEIELEEVMNEELEEAVNMDKVQNTYKGIMKGGRQGPPDDNEVGDYIPKGMTKADIAALIKMLAKQGYDAKFLTKDLAPLAEAKRDPSKSGGSGYDLYHKDFSTAMKHAYDYAKKKFGITIDPKEIDDKVASGPRKPSSGKTNTYRLKGDKGSVQIQVANLDNKKYELNMYKEEFELDEGFKVGDKVKAKKGSQSNNQRHYETKVGTIVKDYKDGDFKVNFGGNDDASIAGKDLVKESVELDEGRVYVKTSEGDAYDAGKKAVAKGISYDDNPNKKGTKEYTAWSKGHNDARATKISNKHFGQPRLKREEVEMENIEEAEFFKWEVKVGGRSWRGTARNAGEAVKKARPSMGNLDLSKASVTRIKEDVDVEEKTLSLEEAVMLSVFGEAKKDEKKDKKAPETDKDDDGEGMDAVDKKALKKDYDDRAKDGDGDLDNDGDEDKTDKYLHKRRQAVTKAIGKKKGPESSKKGEPVDTNPTMDEEKGEEMSSAEKEKKDEIMKKLEQRKQEFEDKYGDRAKEVMARTAIKMAKKHA
jgi:hypothetical protein